MSTLADTIHRNLVAFMKERGFNNPELADYSGVPQGTIQKYVNGQRTPKAEQLSKLAEALGREPGDFFMPRPPPARPLEEKAIRLKARSDVPEDIIEMAREHERKLNRLFMDRVHEEKKKLKRK